MHNKNRTVAGIAALGTALLISGSQVLAGPLNITINDPNATNGSAGSTENQSGLNSWDKGAGNPQAGYWTLPGNAARSDFREVEPGMSTGQTWDLGAFVADNAAKKLGVLTGYDMKNNNGTTTNPNVASDTKIGDLFISFTGPNNYPEPTNYDQYTQNTAGLFDYKLAIRFNFTLNTYSVYELDSHTRLENAIFYNTNSPANYNAASDPWRIATTTAGSTDSQANLGHLVRTGSLTWTPVIGNDARNIFQHSYLPGLSNSQYNAGQYALAASYSYLELQGLAWMADYYTDINNPQSWFHLTMSCGNDNLMGYDSTGFRQVPDGIATLTLLGASFIGMALVRRRSKS